MAETQRPSNIEKSLVEAPEDSFTLSDEELSILNDQEKENISIEIEENNEGGAEIMFGEQMTVVSEPDDFFGNLAETLDETTLSEIASDLSGLVEDDKVSRKDWEDVYTKGLDLLGLKYENRTTPFEGATGVIHPLLNEAVTQFQAGAYKEMLPSGGPVRAQIVGTPSPAVEQQAVRVQEYMNYQIMYKMEEFEPELDQMLYYLGLAGSAFKKVYNDETLQRPVSKFVPAEDVIVPYTATDLRSAERVTHVLRMSKNELRKLQVGGSYLDMDISTSDDDPSSITEKYDELEGLSRTGPDDDVTLYECHCYLDLEDFPDVGEDGEQTGIKLPYIVTTCYDTNDILSIRRNYSPDDPMKSKLQHFVQYKFTPGLGFYGFGLIHLLGNLSRTATSSLRQLIDSGTLANLPAGFKARGLRIADDAEPLQPGEFRDVDVPGGDIRTSLMALPYKEPSQTLFQLMGFVVGAAEKFIGTTDLAVGDSSQEMPVGTTIALLERGARIVSSVHKRLHASMKIELKMLAKIFGEDPTPYPYEVNQDKQIKKQDFDDRIDVLPVSDPNMFSMSQRVVLAQEQLKLAQAAPDLHNLYETYKRVYEALGVNNIDQILKPQKPSEPHDPATENQEASEAAMGQLKLQAFAEQDHDAHIAVHAAYMKSLVAQMQPPVLMTLEKHIYEHIGLKAQVMASQQMSPEQAKQNPEAMSNLIAQTQAQLIQQYLEANPPASQDDPLVEIKKQEIALKAKDQAEDQAHQQAELQFDRTRLAEQSQVQRERIQSSEDMAMLRAQQSLQQNKQRN